MRILLHVICRGRREWATDIVFVYLKCYLSKDLLNFKKYSTLGFFSPFFSFPFSFHVENNTQAGSHSYKCCTNELHPLAPKSCLLIQEITKGVRWPISNSSKGFIFTFSTYLEKFSLKKYFEKKKKRNTLEAKLLLKLVGKLLPCIWPYYPGCTQSQLKTILFSFGGEVILRHESRALSIVHTCFCTHRINTQALKLLILVNQNCPL